MNLWKMNEMLKYYIKLKVKISIKVFYGFEQKQFES
jgi:hypothetical protein